MRDEFFEWYPLTEAELEHIWRDGMIVPDANLLLSFYRWSDKTRDDLFSRLDRLSDRLWVPHQAALEYHRSRVGVINIEVEACGTFIDALNVDLMQVLENPQRHPSVSEPTFERLRASWDAVVAELREKARTLKALVADDPVRDRISALTAHRVGPPLSAEWQARLEQEGPRRYEEKIPPGYMDDRKKKSPQQKWGDLVIWFQMMEEATRSGKPVIFVTEDWKEDWWRIEHKKKLGARPELIAEFRQTTGQLLVFYTAAIFMQRAGARAGAVVDPSSVREMQANERMFVDRTLVCADCGNNFAFTADQQQFYAERGWDGNPRRCKECANERKRQRLEGLLVRDGPPPLGSDRQMYAITCTLCGMEGTVPFSPSPGKPILCRSCFRTLQDEPR